MKMRKLAVLLLAAFMIASAAEAEGDTKIKLSAPSGWTSDASAAVRIEIETDAAFGSYTVETRMDNDPWEDRTAYFSDGRFDYPITVNGMLSVRVVDELGHETTGEAVVACFDRDAPQVSVKANDTQLHIIADDPQSGVAGVQVNSLLYTTLHDHMLDIDLTGELCHFERIAVRAFDYCGNFSDLISLDNPCYLPEITPTPTSAQTATTVPTATPTALANNVSNEQKPAETPSATPTATALNAAALSWADILSGIYVQPTPAPTPAATEVPMPTPVIQTEYITLGPGMPYTPEGNAHTLDMLYSAATNKQFITIETKKGNTFYLVIDYDKPIDKDAELYQTYFLNLVDERDLMALMDDGEIETLPTPTPEIIYVTPEPTIAPIPTAVPTAAPTTAPPAPDDGKNQQTATLALAGLMVLAGIGIFLLLKNRGYTQRKSISDYGLDDEDEEDESEDSGDSE